VRPAGEKRNSYRILVRKPEREALKISERRRQDFIDVERSGCSPTLMGFADTNRQKHVDSF
jgi:hypothetical protein